MEKEEFTFDQEFRPDVKVEDNRPAHELGGEFNPIFKPVEVVKKDDEFKLAEVKPLDKEVKTEHYIGGRKVLASKADLDKYKELLADLDKSQNGRLLADIPLSDEYYIKKAALESFLNALG